MGEPAPPASGIRLEQVITVRDDERFLVSTVDDREDKEVIAGTINLAKAVLEAVGLNPDALELARMRQRQFVAPVADVVGQQFTRRRQGFPHLTVRSRE